MIFKISLQNLFRHPRQSLLLVAFIFVFSIVFFIGISLADSINSGVESFYTNNITGNYVVYAGNDNSMSVFGSVTLSLGEFVRIPELAAGENVLASVDNELIAASTPIISGNALLDFGGPWQAVSYFGIDSETFFDFSSGLQIVEGSVIDSRGGALIHIDKRNEISAQSGIELSVGDAVLLNVYGDNGFRIREVIIRGFYTYGSGQMKNHLLIDVSAARGLQRIFESQEVSDIQDDQVDLLDMGFDADSFFTDSDSLTPNNETGDDAGFDLLDSVFDIEVDTAQLNVSGGWHFLLLKTNPDVAHEQLQHWLNAGESGNSIMTWQQAAGQAAMLGLLFSYFFTGGFILAALAGIIGISNVLTISVINRSKEIGTIRALGGQKMLVAGILLFETSCLTFLGSLLAVFFGACAINAINSLNINVSNQLLMSIFSGHIVHLNINGHLMFQVLCAAFFISLPAVIIQIKRALTITPLQALTRSK